MNNFIFCLNATMPIFFTMLLGILFKRTGLFDDEFVNKLNKFVFNAALPALLFNDISTVDFREVWDGRMVAFCFSVTLLSIFISTAVSFLFDRKIQGEFIQGSYRSSSAILGIAFMQNIYGASKIAPLMVISSVPLYNVMAVIVLSLFKPDREKLSPALLKKTLSGILHNPIILGIAAGVIWSVLRIPQPVILEKTAANLGMLATPLGLMAMGGSIRMKQAFSNPVPTLVCTAMKLCGYVALFLPLAVHIGFREEKLVSMLVMLGSSTTVSCFIMSKNMGHEGQFSSGIIMMTTLLSAVTLTAELYILKSTGLI